MTRSRWRIAEAPFQCKACHEPIDTCDVHVGNVCLVCCLPMIVKWEDADGAWNESYRRALTEAMHASRASRTRARGGK